MTDCNKCGHIMQMHAIMSQDFKVVGFKCSARGCNCHLEIGEYKG